MFLLYRKWIGGFCPLVVTNDFQIAKDELFKIVSLDAVSRLERGELSGINDINPEKPDEQIIDEMELLIGPYHKKLSNHYKRYVRTDREYELFLVDQQEWLVIEPYENLKVIIGENTCQ